MKPALAFSIPQTPEFDPLLVPGAGACHLDVPYVPGGCADQRLDLYLPAGQAGPCPLIIYLHEGAFAFGSKRDRRLEVVFPLLAQGYAIASVDYRKSDAVTWPAQIFDAKAAVRFLRADAARYGLNPQRFVAWGVSAGAYLASMLGVTGDRPGFEDPGMGHADASSAVQAVIDWFGCCGDFARMDDQIRRNGFGRPNHSQPNSPEAIMMGGPLHDIEELCYLAAPTNHVHADIPPFLIQHGSLDPVTPVQQSVEFAAAIERAAGSERARLIVYDAGHDTDQFYASPQAREDAFDFLSQVFNS